jgi:PKD repeat protein
MQTIKTFKIIKMKKQYYFYTALLLLFVVAFTQCKKTDELELSGAASTADFTFTQPPISDTLPYTSVVSFTSNSKDEFLYQWNFGDFTGLSSEKNPKHTYATGGVYNVTLTTVGTNGNNSITKVVSVNDACNNALYNTLTSCNQQEWTWSSDGDAIKVLSPDATQVYFAGAAAPCQADDLFKFGKDGSFGYNANGQTFDVQSGYSCQPQKPNAPSFKLISKPGQQPKIVLSGLLTGSGRPFIGTTDVVDSNLYKVMSFTPTTMTLRATLEGQGGVLLEMKFKKFALLTLPEIKNLVTGTTSKTWKLDDTPGANPVIVGTEANPSQYFGGGALEPTCQADDRFTFFASNTITYNANGSTFNGGNITPNFNCGLDRSYSNVAFTFGPTTSGAGIATIQLPNTPPTVFIGVTDVPNENLYRIIDITPTKMTLRAGNGSGTVFQFKFVAL